MRKTKAQLEQEIKELKKRITFLEKTNKEMNNEYNLLDADYASLENDVAEAHIEQLKENNRATKYESAYLREVRKNKKQTRIMLWSMLIDVAIIGIVIYFLLNV